MLRSCDPLDTIKPRHLYLTTSKESETSYLISQHKRRKDIYIIAKVIWGDDVKVVGAFNVEEPPTIKMAAQMLNDVDLAADNIFEVIDDHACDNMVTALDEKFSQQKNEDFNIIIMGEYEDG